MFGSEADPGRIDLAGDGSCETPCAGVESDLSFFFFFFFSGCSDVVSSVSISEVGIADVLTDAGVEGAPGDAERLRFPIEVSLGGVGAGLHMSGDANGVGTFFFRCLFFLSFFADDGDDAAPSSPKLFEAFRRLIFRLLIPSPLRHTPDPVGIVFVCGVV